MKKKLIITIISVIVTVLLAMYITSIATSFSVGDSIYLGMGYLEQSLVDSNGNKVTNAKNVINPDNFDYFCAKRGVDFGTGGRAFEFKNIAKVEIQGNQAELTAGSEYGILGQNLYIETYTEQSTNSNKVFALLFYKIKDGTATIDEVDGNGVKTGNRVNLTRSRHITEYYGFPFDFGQWAMWRNLIDWRNNVGLKMDRENQTLWNKLLSVIQSEEPSNAELSNTKNQAYRNGKELYQEVVEEATKINVNNEFGIEETYYNNDSSDKEVETRIDEDSNTILGPFKYNFVGTIESGKPTLTFNEDTTPQQYTIGTYIGSTFTETNKIVSGNEFYIKVTTTALTGVTSIHFNFQIEGISLFNTATTVYFFERSENIWSYQPIIHVEQTEGYNKPFTDSYKISKLVEISLEKLNENGNKLKAEGIKFQIKDDTNTVIAYIKTDANGEGKVTDAQGNTTGETKVTLLTGQTYTLIEKENNVYGYRKRFLDADNIEISGAEIEQSGNNIKFILNEDCEDNVKIKAKNQKELAKLEIQKNGEDGTKLENVAFAIKIGTSQYLQLRDTNNEPIASAKGTVTINSNNKANSTEYSVKYVGSKSNATQFITDSNGKIVINNLEVNKSDTQKYNYTAYETYNSNYGYGSKENTLLEETVTELKLNEANQIEINNIQDLGNLQVTKYDEDNNNILLSDVGFAIELSPSLEKQYAYLALYNQSGELVQNVRGTVTINSKNVAVASEYKLNYYYSDKAYVELTDEEKSNLTTFITGDNGKLTLNNLEVYSPKTGDKYTYKLIETSNLNYGYDIDSVELGNVILETNSKTSAELGNTSEYTKISGYVWIENSTGKRNQYDGIYTEGNSSEDIKLTDLYIVKNGQLEKNPGSATKIEIKLRNKVTGEFIKGLPDEFDTTGKYTFVDVEIENLENYEVVFVYNGFYYTTIVEQLEQANGSKVKEIVTERETLNNKFATVKDNSEVVSVDGTVNTVEYYKDGHTSTVSKLNFDTSVTATTSQTSYNLKEKYNALKANATGPVEAVENVNMGIVLREQPKISINNDIYSAQVEFEGYTYNYKYNGRQNYYENKNGDDIGVKFEQENTKQRYTRTVYASDIQAAKDQGKEIKVSITYKMQIANESRTLRVMPKQIINYFDARYDIKAVGLNLDESTHIATNELTYSELQNAQGNTAYKSAVIDFNRVISSINSEDNVQEIYITFDVQRDAIIDLLNSKSTYHNVSEILSYVSYYEEYTSISDEKQFITEQKPANTELALYAGIDKMSQPGNMKLKLVDHPDGDGTQILDTEDYEDDTASAPSLILEATEERKLSGTIWEDSITNTTNNQKLGDGIYKEDENVVQGVTVSLHKVNADGTVGEIATYSNGEQVITETDESGNYTFGYYDSQNQKHVGILPGKYVIKYTYNNEDYIVGNKNINVNDYKSTIITSEVIKNAFESTSERWYLVQENNRYSDARDDINLRPEYNPNIDANITVTNSTYNTVLKVDSIDAYTPKMDIGIEFTEQDEADALTIQFEKELENIDFGIVERPDIDITIEKQITGLEIIAQNGTVIIPQGNPSNPGEEMQYVRTGLDGLVPAEIDPELLQGAQLNLEYTITVINNSDKDYLEVSYYYYGTGGQTETTTKVKQVVDYLDITMSLDPEQSKDIWKEMTADALYNEGNGFITEEVYNELISGNYHILTTNAFEEVETGSGKSVKLYTTRYLAISDSITEQNKVEIIELTGKRPIKDTEPGNNPPDDPAKEQDEDKVELIITPPTGTTVNYIIYIITGIITFIILVSGIVIIKKKIIK